MSYTNLPNSTKLNQFIAKYKLSDRINNGKIIFSNINKITWKYKLSPTTSNIQKTPVVEEIHIFEIELKSKEIPKKAIVEIDKLIHYPLLYRFTYEDDFCYGISLLSEKQYFFSQWGEDIEFDFSAFNLEQVYENIVKKFLKNVDSSKNLTLNIELNNRILVLQKDINSLTNKIKKEKQFKKQLELSRLLKPKEKELEDLTSTGLHSK